MQFGRGRGGGFLFRLFCRVEYGAARLCRLHPRTAAAACWPVQEGSLTTFKVNSTTPFQKVLQWAVGWELTVKLGPFFIFGPSARGVLCVPILPTPKIPCKIWSLFCAVLCHCKLLCYVCDLCTPHLPLPDVRRLLPEDRPGSGAHLAVAAALLMQHAAHRMFRP